MYKNISIDTEGLSLQTNAAVLQLAAIPFNTCLTECDDPKSKFNGLANLPDHIFNSRIFAGDYPAEGYDVADETMAWWMDQDDASRNLAFSGMKSKWSVATEFSSYIARMQAEGLLARDAELRVWIRNAPFDWHVVKNFMEQEGQVFPFHHRSVREYYGIVDHVPKEAFSHVMPNPLWHDAACDALHQARMICAAQMYWAQGTPPVYEQ